MTLWDSLKVPKFGDLDFSFLEIEDGIDPFLQQTTRAAYKIRDINPSNAVKACVSSSSAPTTTIVNISRSSNTFISIPEGPSTVKDDKPNSHADILEINHELNSGRLPLSASEGMESGSTNIQTTSSGSKKPTTLRKRKTGRTITSKPDAKKTKKGDVLLNIVSEKTNKEHFASSGFLLENLNKYLTGGKSARDKAPLKMPNSMPFVKLSLVDNVRDDNIDTNVEVVMSEEGKKAVSFSCMDLSSFLGLDRPLEGDGDQVSSVPPSWFKSEEVKNKAFVMDALTTKLFVFNLNTSADHARGRKMGGHELGKAGMLNQAQLNVYVKELYRRWIESKT
ncbi:hypothetical protein HanRHA438_Chr12g0566981 [Helianthus annuus]|uniref:Uncharacterized protein n=1 Tax=Helianthus annuus TaxID=4232 RepID=A0A9K3HIS2_HELAN|nr:hypothetical protein HanXRQr2_Chr12g0555551 [Helianthus annuus]KAJ0490429.1 hypothetical protein HanHA300_Chr12g0455351 [Helianthus annuus]KAJ0494632.1 hypothetical protein HanIR_Chr12g0599651 [Helianthus annuus]KAJ0506347.1 hypothetical protein HanHA89_Chr12g0480931 [Helianthus annuus]KAJ0676023.1 hypothetical protein HanLR1_Chr12g0457901 [Helianthus annuus]